MHVVKFIGHKIGRTEVTVHIPNRRLPLEEFLYCTVPVLTVIPLILCNSSYRRGTGRPADSKTVHGCEYSSFPRLVPPLVNTSILMVAIGISIAVTANARQTGVLEP